MGTFSIEYPAESGSDRQCSRSRNDAIVTQRVVRTDGEGRRLVERSRHAPVLVVGWVGCLAHLSRAIGGSGSGDNTREIAEDDATGCADSRRSHDPSTPGEWFRSPVPHRRAAKAMQVPITPVNTHDFELLNEHGSENAIPISQKVARCTIPWKGLQDLMSGPLGSRMRGHGEVNNTSAVMG